MSIVNEKMKCGCVALLALLLTAVRFDLPGNPAHAQENGTPSSVDDHRSADTTANSIWLDGHVLWSYGTGNVGYGDGELAGPHSAEENPFRPDEILVAYQGDTRLKVLSLFADASQRAPAVAEPLSWLLCS